MKRTIFALALLALLPLFSHVESRETWEILGQVIPPGATAAAVNFSTSPANQASYATLLTSTGAATNASATLAIPARSTRVATVFVSECANSLRIGDASITTSVGAIIPAGASVNLDAFSGPYRGELYVINTAVGSCNWSTLEVLP